MQKPVVRQVEPQEDTLQLESQDIADSGVEQTDPEDVHAQDIEENEVSVAEDSSQQQIQDANTESQDNEEQQDIEIPEDQISRASQENNYHTATDEEEENDTIQFGNLVTQPFLSRSVRVPTTKVGCLSFTQML